MDRLLTIRDKVLATLEPLPAELASLDAAAGRWLAVDARAEQPSPPHTCSAMDGWAVRAGDALAEVWLRAAGTTFAGDAAAPALGKGEAVRIYTGAPLPPGADAVVRQEAAREERGGVRLGPVRPGENIRAAGEDVRAGEVALAAGARLGARERALLAAVGVREVQVRRPPRVEILSTGDELVAGRTPDSNGVAVAGLVRALGAEVRRRQVPDRLEDLEAALRDAAGCADAVLTIGGVSVGARDLVPAALARLGADVGVHGVPMKPGKPFLFARLGPVAVLALPGSPSACLAAFEVFARPALLALSGAARPARPAVRVALAAASAGRRGRARLVWAALDPDGRARPLGKDAAQVRGPALADALLFVPADTGELPEGAEVTAWLLERGEG